MTENEKNEETKEQPEVEKKPRKARTGTPKSTGMTLKDASGSTLRFTAMQTKDGGAKTFAVYRQVGPDGKLIGEVKKGATQTHENLDKARAALEKLVAQATSAGWQRKATSGVGRAKPDAFDLNSLPKAKKGK